MNALKGSDKFRSLLKKFEQPAPSNPDTSIRKSNRERKKAVIYDASPAVPNSKPSKPRDQPVVRRKEPVRNDSKSKGRLAAPQVGKSFIPPEPREEVRTRQRSPQTNSAFRRVVTNENQRSTANSHNLQEPNNVPLPGRVIHTNQQNRDRLDNHVMPMDMNSSYVVKRGQQDVETSFASIRRTADRYGQTVRDDVFTRPLPLQTDQSRSIRNASRNYDTYGDIRKPVSRMNTYPDDRQPSGRLTKMWQTSRLPPPEPPRRFDGGFLRPPTPPDAAKFAEMLETALLDALTKFNDCEILSTVEIVYDLNRLKDRLIQKISKTIRQSNSAQSAAMKLNTMETISEDIETSGPYEKVQAWLRTNESSDPSRVMGDADFRSKRIREPADRYTKRMRIAPGYDDDSHFFNEQRRHLRN